MRLLHLTRSLAVAGALLTPIALSACQDAVVDAPLTGAPFSDAQALASECYSLSIQGPNTVQVGANGFYRLIVHANSDHIGASEGGNPHCGLVSPGVQFYLNNPPPHVSETNHTTTTLTAHVGTCASPNQTFTVRGSIRFWGSNGTPQTVTVDKTVTITPPDIYAC